MIHVDAQRDLIAVIVARRVIRLAVAFRVFGVDLAAVLLHVITYICNGGKVDQIGVLLAVIRAATDEELSHAAVDIDLGMRPERLGRMERLEQTPVLFPRLQLTADLLHRGVAALIKKRRQFSGAVLAKISVLELAVSEHADLFTADVTVLLVKQTHRNDLPCKFA